MVMPVAPMVISSGIDWSSMAQQPGSGVPAQQPTEADRHDFAALMQNPSPNAARLEPGAAVTAPSMIEHFAATQNADMRELMQSTRDLVKAAPSMSMSEVMAYGNEMTMNIAVTTTQYNVAGNLAKSASKGVDTLMRNQ